MKPIIGMTMNNSDGRYFLNEPYVEAIEKNGGIPICIPIDSDEIVEMIDGLLLTGGYDIDPKYFGEEPHPKLGIVTAKRDAVEMQLVRKCLEKGIPIFGICRGLQLLNVFFGGNIYQDINTQFKTNIEHQQKEERTKATHEVVVEKNSKLFSIIEMENLFVNSMHHQAIRKVGERLTSVASAPDGIVEAIELENYPFCVAVQWHPEELAKAGDLPSKKMFESFIESANDYNKNKYI